LLIDAYTWDIRWGEWVLGQMRSCSTPMRPISEARANSPEPRQLPPNLRLRMEPDLLEQLLSLLKQTVDQGRADGLKFETLRVTYSVLADELGCSKSTIHTYLYRLKERGLIDLQQGPRGSIVTLKGDFWNTPPE
jgi:hypothetical protein